MRPTTRFAALLFTTLLVGCTTTGGVRSDAIVQAFSGIEEARDPTYGYTVENAVLVGQFGSGSQTSFAASRYLMLGLRKDGQPLRLLYRAQLMDRTDQWTVVPEGTTDTLEVHINVYRSGTLRVPQGLTFEPPPIQE